MSEKPSSMFDALPPYGYEKPALKRPFPLYNRKHRFDEIVRLALDGQEHPLQINIRAKLRANRLLNELPEEKTDVIAEQVRKTLSEMTESTDEEEKQFFSEPDAIANDLLDMLLMETNNPEEQTFLEKNRENFTARIAELLDFSDPLVAARVVLEQTWKEHKRSSFAPSLSKTASRGGGRGKHNRGLRAARSSDDSY